MFLEISQNSQEKTCAGDSFLKNSLWPRCFPVNFAKFLRTPFSQNSSGWLLMLRDYFTFRSSHQRCSIKKVFLEISQNSHNLTKQLHQSLYFNKVSILIKVSGLQLIKKDTLAQVFSCEFYEISKNIFFTEHLWTTASVPLETNLPSYPIVLSKTFQFVFVFQTNFTE